MTHYGTVQTVKQETNVSVDKLNVATEAELDEYIQAELEEASSEIDRFCNRTFRLVEGYEETRFGNGRQEIQLQNYPVQSIQSVDAGGKTFVEGEDYEIKDRRNFNGENNGVLVRLQNGKPTKWLKWNQNTRYEFVYDWGYPNEEYPQVLDSVAEDLVVSGVSNAIAQNAASEKGGASSVSMDGFSVSYDIADSVTDAQITSEQLERLKSLQEARII